MTKVLKPILENDLLTEEAKTQIQEAFDAKLKEVRHETEVQLREEFAARYNHDKDILIQAVERMVGEGLKAEIAEFAVDRSKLTEKHVQLTNEIRKARKDAKNKLSEQINVLESFVLNTLKTELSEFATDRKIVKEAKKNLAKQINENKVAYKQQLTNKVSLLETFVIHQLKKEIGEFQADKKSLLEQRVKMITEGKTKIESTRKEFIKRASNLVEANVTKYLKEEMYQFKEDIHASRQKAFGQKLFNEYAAEFKASFFNENAEVRKLKAKLSEVNTKFKKANKIMESAKKVADESRKRQRLAESTAKRTVIMTDLLNKLSGSKKEVMSELLEGVKTQHLKEAFKKYVPVVTSNNGTFTSSKLNKKSLTESISKKKTSVFTGNRKKLLVEEENTSGYDNELDRVRKLAGI